MFWGFGAVLGKRVGLLAVAPASSPGANASVQGASAELRFAADVHLRPTLPTLATPSQPPSDRELLRRRELLARSRGELELARELRAQIFSGYEALALDTPFSSPEASEQRTEPPSLAAAPPEQQTEPPAREAPAKPRADRQALSKNPRVLSYHRRQVAIAASALARANQAAVRGPTRLIVPREVYQVAHDICDDARALAGALEWVRVSHGPAVLLEVEAAALYRVPGGRQIDDWSCPRARRKAAFLVFGLMSPHELERSAITGSPSTELVRVTCGVNQDLLCKILRSGQREPYCERTLQRDLAEIDKCTTLVLRWRTPAAKAQPWERNSERGTMNRYCIRAGMVRERWRRARDAGQALAKRTVMQFARWLVWQPAPARGERVPLELGQPEPAG